MEVPSHIVAPEGIELKQSEVDTSQIGVWCVTPIPKGTIFGPFVGEIVYEHKDKKIDYRFAWEVFDLEKNELSHIVNATDPMKGNWMRYVNCARFLEEQNIVSVQDNGQVFYKAIKDVDPNEELLTWFQPFKKRRRRRKNASIDGKSQDGAVPVKTKSQPKVKTPSKAKSNALETDLSSPKSSSSKIMKEDSTESAKSSSAMATKPVPMATEPAPVAPPVSTNNYIDSPVEILETKRQRKKKKLFDEEILLTDLVFKKKRRRRSKEEIERDAIKAALNAQIKGKRKRGRRKKSEMMITEETPPELPVDNDERGSREDSPMKASPVLENLEEVEGNTVDSLEKSWTYPAKHHEYQFSLRPHFGITQNGRRVYRCDVCSGVYKHTFSLKRHYLRNHINCRYLSRADITNCMILIGQQQLAILKSNEKDLLKKVDETLIQTLKDESCGIKDKERSDIESQDMKEESSNSDSKENKMENIIDNSKIDDLDIQASTDSTEKKLQDSQEEQTTESNTEVKIKKENSTEESQDDEMQSTSDKPLPSMAGLYKCNICYKLFDEIEALKLHTQDHPKVLDVKGFACDRCHMRFTYKQNLVRHQMVHEGETEKMGKLLPTTPVKTKSKLTEKKVPVVGKPFKCPRCPMKFKYTTNLERHEALHFADRSFICSYCGKGFPSATNMKKHEHIHLGSRVPCKYCTAVFVHVGSLRKHIRLEHPDIHRQRLLKLLEKRGKLGTKAARTLQESYHKDTTSNFREKVPGSSHVAHSMKISKEGKVPIREESDSKFKFSCAICKKRFTAFVNMCRHRRLAHKDNSKIPRIPQTENSVTETTLPSPVKPKRQLSRLRILMGSPKRDEEPITFETANDPIDNSPEANVNFYANVAANIAENLTSYIDGGADSMAHFKQHIRIKDYDSVFTTVKAEAIEESEKMEEKEEFQWEKFNFPKNYDPVMMSDNFVDLTELAPLGKVEKSDQVMDETSYNNKVPAFCTRRRTSREGISSAENSRDGFECGHFQQKQHQLQNEIKTEIKMEPKDDNADKTDDTLDEKANNADIKTGDEKEDKMDDNCNNEDDMENKDEKEESLEDNGKETRPVLKLPLMMMRPKLTVTSSDEDSESRDICDKNEVQDCDEQRKFQNDGKVSNQSSCQQENCDMKESNESLGILSKTEPLQARCGMTESNSESLESLSKADNIQAKCGMTESNSESLESLSKADKIQAKCGMTESNSESLGSSSKAEQIQAKCDMTESNSESLESLSKADNIQAKCDMTESNSESLRSSSKAEQVDTKEKEGNFNKPSRDNGILSGKENKTKDEKQQENSDGTTVKVENIINSEDALITVKTEDPVQKNGINNGHFLRIDPLQNAGICDGNKGSSSVSEDLGIEKATKKCELESREKETNEDRSGVVMNSSGGLMISNVVGGTEVAELWCHETLSSISPDNLSNGVDLNRNNNNTTDLNKCPQEEDSNSGYSSPGVYNPPLSSDSESELDFGNCRGAVSAAQLIQGLNLAKAQQNWRENNNTDPQDDRMISAERIYRSLLKLKDEPDQSPQHSPLHNFDSIAFGNFGKRAYVCSVCKRHFSDYEAVLRHQLKKHPLVACHALEIEDGHDIEYLYYTQPSSVGILGGCGKALEKISERNSYTCTRCNGSFKNIDRLHIHIMNCAPKPDMASETLDRLPRKRRRKFPKKLMGMDLESKEAEQRERDELEQLSRNYIAKLKAQKKIFMGCRKRKLIDVPIGENSNDTKMRRRRSYEIGYNPGNHVRRREMTELLDTHQCKGCGVKFKSISLLERHVRKCDGKEKFKDLKVMKSTVNESFHKKHKQICLYCQRGFAYPKTLMNHYRAFCVVKKDKLTRGTLTEVERIKEAEMIVRLKQQDEDRNEAVSVHHMEEVEGHRKGWPKGLKRKSRRKNHCWTYIKKRKSSNDALDNDDDLSETGSQMSSDSPSKSGYSLSPKSESSLSPKSPEPVKSTDGHFSNSCKSGGSNEENVDTRDTLECKERSKNPVMIKIEPLENFDSVMTGGDGEDKRLEQKDQNDRLNVSQNVGNVVKQTSDINSLKGNQDRSKIGQSITGCKLVKYSVDTLSPPASDRPMLTLKPVIEGTMTPTKPQKGHPSTGAQPSTGSTLPSSVCKSPAKKVKKKKVEQEKVSPPMGVMKTESGISSLSASLGMVSSPNGSSSSINTVSSQQTTPLAMDAKVLGDAAIVKSPKKQGKKMADAAHATKLQQDSAVSKVKNSVDLSSNEAKCKNSPKKIKGVTSPAKLPPPIPEKRVPFVLNCPDLSKVVGKTDSPKKNRKLKRSEISVETKVKALQQNQNLTSSTVSVNPKESGSPVFVKLDLQSESKQSRTTVLGDSCSSPGPVNPEAQKDPLVPRKQKLCKNEIMKNTNICSVKILNKMESTNESNKKDLVIISTKQRSVSEGSPVLLQQSEKLNNGLESKITDGTAGSTDTFRKDLIKMSQKSGNSESSAVCVADQAKGTKLCKTDKMKKECEGVTQNKYNVNNISTKQKKMIFHLGSDQICVTLPDPAISSVLNSTSKTLPTTIGKIGAKVDGNSDSRETTFSTEEVKKEQKSNTGMEGKKATTTTGNLQKTVPNMGKVSTNPGKIENSNMQLPVQKSQIPTEERGLVRKDSTDGNTTKNAGKFVSQFDDKKKGISNVVKKTVIHKSEKNTDLETIFESLKKQQKPAAMKQQRPKPKQQKSKQEQSENFSKEAAGESPSKSPARTLQVKLGNDMFNVEIPVISQSEDTTGRRVLDQSTKIWPATGSETFSAKNTKGLKVKQTTVSSTVINVPQIQTDTTVKPPRKRRKTAPKTNVLPSELKATECVQTSARLSVSPDKMSHDQGSNSVSTDKFTKVLPSTDQVPNVNMSNDTTSKVNKYSGSLDEFDSLAPMNNLLQLACIATDVLKGVVVSSDEEEKAPVHQSTPFHCNSVLQHPNPLPPVSSPKLVAPNSSNVDTKILNNVTISKTPKLPSPSLSVQPVNSNLKTNSAKVNVCFSKAGLTVNPMSVRPLKTSPRKKRVSRSPMKLATREELLSKCGLSPHTDMFTNTTASVKGDNPEQGIKGDKSKTSM